MFSGMSYEQPPLPSIKYRHSYGLLHRIPPVHEESQLDSQSYDDTNAFIPADNEEYHLGHDGTQHRGDIQSTHGSQTSPNSAARRVGQLEANHYSSHYLDPPIRSTASR